MRKSTKLPEGVGRKIIEALKSQPQPTAEPKREADASLYDYNEAPKQAENKSSFRQKITRPQPRKPAVVEEDIEIDDFEQYTPNQKHKESNVDDDFLLDDEESTGNYIVDENDEFEHYQEYETEESNEESPLEDYEIYNEESYEDQESNPLDNDEQYMYEEYQRAAIQEKSPALKQRNENTYSEKMYEGSNQKSQLSPNPNSNVNVLMNLVYQLPPGVTKQTGAHIIRQTMEAMGMPMNKVLAEAQNINEELGDSIKNNINTIEEYRNNIKTLEKDVQICRKKSEEIEELIGLFTLIDR